MRGLLAKRVLITGGASGIGAATAARFLDEGSVVCVLDCDADARRKIAHELPDLAGTLDADVSNLKQVEAAFEEAIKLMGGVDVLVNNAGISIRHNFLGITPEEWDKVIAVNLTGVFYVAQTAAKHMMERGSGVILQTASTNGIMGYPFYADYNATKAGVIELSKSMALELAPKVRVCAVAPGYVLTPMQRAEYTDAMLDEVNQKIPLRRHAQSEEIAALFAFLASDDAQYHHGPRLHDRRRRDCRRAGQPITMQNAGQLSGKVALITGGASGIGRATALLFAREGAAVTVADVNQAAGQRVVKEIARAGGRGCFETMDVTRAVDCRHIVDRAMREFARIDILFNNAGIIRRATVLDLTEDDWDRVMAVNVKSIYLLSREVIPHMEKAGCRFDHQHGLWLGVGRWREGCGLLRVKRSRRAADQSDGHRSWAADPGELYLSWRHRYRHAASGGRTTGRKE